MGRFWDDWQLWEKMTFVMAVAIAATVGLGLLKLWHQKRGLKKWKAEALARREQELKDPEMAAASVFPRRLRRGRGDASVPFGVRALESGIEVEGVWHSRGNSPAPSAPGSPLMKGVPAPPMSGTTRVASGSGGSLSRKSSDGGMERSSRIPSLIMPEPVRPQAYHHSHSSSLSQDGTHDDTPRAQSPSYAERSSPSGGESPRLGATAIPRSYKPRQSSHLRFSTGNALDEQTVDAGRRDSTIRVPSGSRPQSQYSRADAFAPGFESPSFNSTASNSSAESSEPEFIPPPNGPRSYTPRGARESFQQATGYTAPNTPPRRSQIDMLPFTRNSRGDLDAGVTYIRNPQASRSRRTSTHNSVPPAASNGSETARHSTSGPSFSQTATDNERRRSYVPTHPQPQQQSANGYDQHRLSSASVQYYQPTTGPLRSHQTSSHPDFQHASSYNAQAQSSDPSFAATQQIPDQQALHPGYASPRDPFRTPNSAASPQDATGFFDYMTPRARSPAATSPGNATYQPPAPRRWHGQNNYYNGAI